MIALEELPLPHEDDDRAFMDVWIQDFGACTLSAADEVGLFDALASQAASAASLSTRLELEQGGVQACCRALVSMGALRLQSAKNGDDLFELTPGARLFWVRASPTYRGREFDRHRDWEQHERIVETLRSGWAPLQATDQSFTESWKSGQISDEAAVNFTRVMHSMILTPSLAAVRSGAFSHVKHLVDVGGGSGALAAALIAHQPNTRATVMDLKPVCRASKDILKPIQTGSKVSYFAANFFEDTWPTDADAFSFSNILHDWPLALCRQLLSRAFQALPPGGRILVHEALLDESSCAPRMATLFNLLMYMNHRGQQFTQGQLFAVIEEQGFQSPTLVSHYSHWSVVAAIKPGS